MRGKGSFKLLFFSLQGSRSNVLLRVSHRLYPHHACDTWIQLFQFTLSDQSFKGTGQDRLPTTSSTWNPNISFIQMARHRRSSLYGRGIVNFADNYSLRSHIPLRSCLVGLRLWSDNVNWNSCIPWTAVDMRVKQIAKSVFFSWKVV